MKKMLFIILLFSLSLNAEAGDFTIWNELSSNPVITGTQSWEGNNVTDGSTILVNGTYYRFYTGGYGYTDVGYATATPNNYPGVWTKYASNPIISHTTITNGVSIAPPLVYKMADGSFRMYCGVYNGTDVRGYLFTATAGGFPTTWTLANSGNPILTVGGVGAWDHTRSQPEAIVFPSDSNDGLWHMFYIGNDNPEGPTSHYKGGHATSSDGITWTKDSNNPVMTISGSGWYSTHILPLGIMKVANDFYITCGGFGGPTRSVCIDVTNNPTGLMWRLGYYKTTNLNSIGNPIGPIIQPTLGTWDQCGTEGADLTIGGNGIVYLSYLGINGPYNPSGGTSYNIGIAIDTSFIWMASNFGTSNKIASLSTGNKVSNFQ